MGNGVQSHDGVQAEMLRIWKPLLLRAVIAAVFGALTIFWQDPTADVMAISGAFYLLGTGMAVHWLRDRLRRLAGTGMATGNRLTLGLLRLSVMVLLVCGLLAVMFRTPEAFAVTVSVGLLTAGALELFLGVRHRRGSVLGRDWSITGVVNLGAGLLMLVLPLLSEAGPHGLLGVLGGSAIITAVVLLLASLGYRHDTRSGVSVPPEAVN